MARPRSGNSGRRRRPRVDWVQNGDTYTPNFTAHSPSASESIAGILVYPAQAERVVFNADTTIVDTWMGAARPNWRRRQVVRAVRGSIEMRPLTTWTASNVRSWGFRIAKFKYDTGLGQVIVPVIYNMYGNSGIGPDDETGPYVYADDPFVWEHRMVQAYRSDQPEPYWKVNVRWNGRCTLEEDECFAMYIEGDETFGTGAMNVRTWLRTLVEVPD